MRAKKPEVECEVANLTHDTKNTREKKDQSTETHPRKSTKLPDAGYKVANLIGDIKNARETNEKSTEAHSDKVARKRPHPSRCRQSSMPYTTHARLDPSTYRQYDTEQQKDGVRDDPSRY